LGGTAKVENGRFQPMVVEIYQIYKLKEISAAPMRPNASALSAWDVHFLGHRCFFCFKIIGNDDSLASPLAASPLV
jgi:hypothetical protein